MKFLFFAALFLLLFPALPAPARAAGPGPGDSCAEEQIGVSQMSGDQTNIVVCLKQGESYVWKPMMYEPVTHTVDVKYSHWYGGDLSSCDSESGSPCGQCAYASYGGGKNGGGFVCGRGPRVTPGVCPSGYVLTGLIAYESSESGGLAEEIDNIGVKCTKVY